MGGDYFLLMILMIDDYDNDDTEMKSVDMRWLNFYRGQRKGRWRHQPTGSLVLHHWLSLMVNDHDFDDTDVIMCDDSWWCIDDNEADD